MSMSEDGEYSQYYQCKYCNYNLPREHYDFTLHSCFANMDTNNETLYVDDNNCIFKEKINEHASFEEYPDENEMYVDKENTNSEYVPKKKGGNKGDKEWIAYDEILIDSVMKRPCLWNYALPVKERGPLSVNSAWNEVHAELEEKFPVDKIKVRWKNLRDSYVKAKKKASVYVASGSGTSEASELTNQTFRYFIQMSFLNDITIPRSSRSNISRKSPNILNESTGNFNIDSSSQLDFNDSISESVSRVAFSKESSDDSSFQEHRKRKTKQSSAEAEFADMINIIKNTTKQQDAIDGWLVHLGSILKKLPYKDCRNLQRKICDLAYEAEEEAGLL